MNQKVKSLAIFIGFSLLQFLIFAGLALGRYLWGVGFLPFWLMLPLAAGVHNRRPASRGILRWLLSLAAALGIVVLVSLLLLSDRNRARALFYLVPAYGGYLVAGTLVYLGAVLARRARKRPVPVRVTLLLAGLLLVASLFVVQKSPFSEIQRAYLQDHAADMAILDREAGFDPLTAGLSGRKETVFLIGEFHGSRQNFENRWRLLKYLHRKQGIRYYLDEGGYSHSILVNRYLESGDEYHLHTMFSSLRGTAGYTRGAWEFWRKVRAYNRTRSAERQIRCVGADMEHQIDCSLRVLAGLLPQGIPAGFSAFRQLWILGDRIRELDFERERYPRELYHAIRRVIPALKETLKENPRATREILGDGFFAFSLIVDNCMTHLRYWEDPDPRLREAAMFRNFVRIFQHLPEPGAKKFFGQWGNAHIYQQPWEFRERFAGMLQHHRESPVRGRVWSALALYHHSRYQDPFSGESRPIIDLHRRWIRGFFPAARGAATLFFLDASPSPFSRSSRFLHGTLASRSRGSLGYFQGVLLVEGSPAARPYRPPDDG